MVVNPNNVNAVIGVEILDKLIFCDSTNWIQPEY